MLYFVRSTLHPQLYSALMMYFPLSFQSLFQEQHRLYRAVLVGTFTYKSITVLHTCGLRLTLCVFISWYAQLLLCTNNLGLLVFTQFMSAI